MEADLTTAPTGDEPALGWRVRAAEHLRSPLTRNGYALLLSSVITSVLGLVYWLLAARLYSEGSLGRGAALVSAMLLVTSLATAGLKRGLIRFVPTAGGGAARLVRRVYGAGLGVAVVGGVVFLAAFAGSDDLPMLHGSVVRPGLFLVGIVGWGLFVLQDAVLIGAGRSTLVPTTNAIFSVLKIAVLIVGYWLLEGWGVYASWVVPAVVTAGAVNLWLFRTGLARLPEEDAEDVTVGEVVRFTGGEYVASFAWHAANYFTPLLVIARAGAAANARYYVAAQIGYTLFLVSSNVTDALVAEGAKAQHGLAQKVRRTAAQTAAVLVPGVAVTVLAARPIMSLFGGGYTGDAAVVLRLLALAALPNAVTTMVIAVAHVRRRMGMVIVIQTAMSVLTLVLSWVLVGSSGIEGVAWAWLLAQLVTAVGVVVHALATEPGFLASARSTLVAVVRSARSRSAQRRARRALDARLGELPADVLPDGPVELLGFQHDLLVLLAGRGADQVVVRLAAGRQGRRGIAAHQSQLRSLHADPRLAPVHALIPRVLRADGASAWLVESVAAGTSAAVRPEGAERDRAVGAGLTVLDALHEASGRQVAVGADLLGRWVHDPVATVASVVGDPRAARGLAVLQARLEDELGGRSVRVARLHGDPSLDNLLFAPDGSEVTGLVDWEASAIGLPECDLMILLFARRVARGGELGAEVVDLLEHGWAEDERALLGTSWSVNTGVRPTTLVLLTWLGHVAANLEKTDRYRSNRWWIRHNVDRVLAALDDGHRAAEPDALDRGDDDVAAVRTPARRPASPPSRAALRLGVLVTLAATWAATSFGAPVPLRAALVLATTIVWPAVMIGRCLGTPGPLVRGVIGTAGSVSAAVLVSEVQLYTGTWSPTAWTLVLGLGSLVLSTRIPRYQPTRPTPPGPAEAPAHPRPSERVG